MTDRPVVLSLALIEGVHLSRLVEDFRELVTTSREDADPAIDRLAPEVYPDDPDASRTFRESTRDDLLERRIADAAVVRDALAGFSLDSDELTEAEARAEQEITIPTDALDAWLRTLTALRLVLASRLDITGDDDHDVDDPRYGVYDWIGFRLEGLILAADA